MTKVGSGFVLLGVTRFVRQPGKDFFVQDHSVAVTAM